MSVWDRLNPWARSSPAIKYLESENGWLKGMLIRFMESSEKAQRELHEANIRIERLEERNRELSEAADRGHDFAELYHRQLNLAVNDLLAAEDLLDEAALDIDLLSLIASRRQS